MGRSWFPRAFLGVQTLGQDPPIRNRFDDFIPPHEVGRTPHPLSRVILDGEGWFECGAAFEHGAGDVEKAVGDGSEGSAVAVTSGSPGCILAAGRAVG